MSIEWSKQRKRRIARKRRLEEAYWLSKAGPVTVSRPDKAGNGWRAEALRVRPA